jgi:hypothetical protein
MQSIKITGHFTLLTVSRRKRDIVLNRLLSYLLCFAGQKPAAGAVAVSCSKIAVGNKGDPCDISRLEPLY